MSYYKELLGEFLGTAILVFIGCGSVAIAVLYYPLELWHIALVWAYGVAAAIYATHAYSHAHLNPAVTLAMVLAKKCDWKKLPFYIIAQVLGAMVASLLLLAVIAGDLAAYESARGILRGEANSYHSAVMFGEFFPNPGYKKNLQVSHLQAYIAEAVGTLVLVMSIFLLDAKNKKLRSLNPIFIGLTVGTIILIVAPYTQAGLNPARDFGPRLVAYYSGWGDAAYPAVSGSFFTVYILGPLVGGAVAYCFHFFIFKRSKY